jgi:hypothetical protein
VLVLDMIEILPPMGKYKYDTYRIHPVKCYIENSVCLWSYIQNVNMHFCVIAREEASIFYLSIDYTGQF